MRRSSCSCREREHSFQQLLFLSSRVCAWPTLAPPAYSFRVGDPFDDLAIVVFLIISWIVAGLVATLRRTLKETLSSVNRKLIDAEERVRNRIGKDLDANIAQRLALIGIKLDEVGRDVPSSAGNILTSIKELREQTARAAAE